MISSNKLSFSKLGVYSKTDITVVVSLVQLEYHTKQLLETQV